MGWLVITGTLITLAGLLGLTYCIVSVARARTKLLDDDAMKARLQVLVAWNLGSLGVCAIGLMTVIIGLVIS